MSTVAFHTLGCKLNFSETSTIGREFLRSGFEKVAFEEKADVYVINTCSVTEEANKKCRYTVRNALGRNPGAYIVVMGCYAQLKPYEIAEIPGVDLVVGADLASRPGHPFWECVFRELLASQMQEGPGSWLTKAQRQWRGKAHSMPTSRSVESHVTDM